MALIASSFLVGVLCLLWLPAFPAGHILWMACGLGACAAIVWRLPRSSVRRHVPSSRAQRILQAAGAPVAQGVARAVAAASAGFLYAACQTHGDLADRWPESSGGERVLATAIVESIPVESALGWSFDASLQIETPMAGRKLRARVFSREHGVRPRAGERWRLLLTLRPPRGRLNPGAVDTERVYFRERLHASGVIVPSRLNVRLDAGHRPITALRERIARRIDQRVLDRDAAALIAALAVGATGEMTREQWHVFNATGTTHLVAISGLHVTLFAFAMLAAGRSLWQVVAYRWVPWPRESFAAVLGIAAAAGYALLAGFSVPTQRSLIMFTAWLLARIAARVCASHTCFALALLAVLLLDPFAPLASGFWLSFAAMAAILLLTESRFARRGALHEAAAVQLGVSATLAPFTLAWFGSASIVGLVANAIAIPVVSWVLVPIILLAVAFMFWLPVLSDSLLGVAAGIHEFTWPWLVAAADSHFAVVRVTPPSWWYACAVVSVCLSLMPWPLGLRIAVLLWLAPLAAIEPRKPMPGSLDVTVLDVGSGTSVVLRTADHVLVYGVGDSYGDEGGAVESALIPLLRSQGLDQVDGLVVSRLRARGSPGVTALLASLPVRKVRLGGGAPADFPGARPCASGETWDWDGVQFTTLVPGDVERDGAQADARDFRDSDLPCALLVEAAGRRLLLPGDPDAAVERLMIESLSLAADAVLVPRNASDSASTWPFIRAVSPRWALVSGTRLRRNGEEKPAVRRWRESGARVLATADGGALRVSFAPGRHSIEWRALRHLDRRLWRAPAGVSEAALSGR